MSDELGFLDSIGVGTQDEEARLRSEARKRGGGTTAGMERGIAGLLGRFATPGKSRQGGIDMLTAQQAGITVKQLEGRRKIRQIVSDAEPDASFEGRIALAKKVAASANESGDFDTVSRTLRQIQNLKEQKVEFDKLQSSRRIETVKADIAETEKGITDAFLDGKPVTGIATIQDGKSGLIINDEQGNAKFEPWGTKLFRELDTSGETLDARIRKLIPKSEFKEFSSMLRNSNEATRKFGRVLDTIIQLDNESRVEGILSTAGSVVTFADQAVNNIKGVLNTFIPAGVLRKDDNAVNTATRQWLGRDAWIDKSKDKNDRIWDSIGLPVWAQDNSAQAQQHRAQIMELAYMAARLAEPSNRGLSDKDIENALNRIAGDTTNPQVMMRRFAEIMGDASFGVESFVLKFHDSIPGASNDDIDKVIGGKLLPFYRDAQQKMFDKFGISINSSGRAVFENPIGPDIAPPPDTTADLAPGTVNLGSTNIQELSREDIEKIARGDF